MIALGSAQAQSVPDAGKILRENQPQSRVTPPEAVPTVKPAERAKRPANETPFTVTQFRITGASLVPEADIQAVLAPYLGHQITFSELEKALVGISQLYQRRGLLARPQVPAQDIVNGIVTINIIEGRLGAVRVKTIGGPRIGEDYVTGVVTNGQQAGAPLRLDRMDRAVNLLNDTPGINATAVLAPGEADAASDILVTVEGKPMLDGSAMLDNAGPVSTSEGRLSANLNLESPAGLGDEFSANVMASLGMQYGRVAYTLPVGYDGLRLGANFSVLRYKLQGSFEPLDAKGDALTVGFTSTYPLIRTSTTNLHLGVAFDYKHFANTAKDIVTSRKSVAVLDISLSGDTTDKLLGGGILLWNADLALGNLDLSGDPTNRLADKAGPATAGGYGRLAATIARLQRLTDQDSLWLSLSGQQAFKNLDSSEKFWLGGPQGVRAFPVSEASGDSGWLSTIELRHNFTPNWQVNAFYDHGSIMLNHNNSFDTTGLIPNHYGLDGIGLGISFTLPARLSLRATVAHKLGGNPGADPFTGNDSDGHRADTRAWLQAVWFF